MNASAPPRPATPCGPAPQARRGAPANIVSPPSTQAPAAWASPTPSARAKPATSAAPTTTPSTPPARPGSSANSARGAPFPCRNTPLFERSIKHAFTQVLAE
jgi:hypothetical protein